MRSEIIRRLCMAYSDGVHLPPRLPHRLPRRLTTVAWPTGTLRNGGRRLGWDLFAACRQYRLTPHLNGDDNHATMHGLKTHVRYCGLSFLHYHASASAPALTSCFRNP